MLTDIRLQNFRSYKDSAFEFSPGVNIVVGPNASGKTNLLEAVLVIATGKSYRTKDKELIRFDEPWARLDAHQDNNSLRSVKITRDGEDTPLKLIIDSKEYKRLPKTQALPVVLFEPNHLLLIKSEPKTRREYLDNLLETTLPTYWQELSRYRRALAQRNSLLKKPKTYENSQMFAWNIRLSELGGKLAASRLELIQKLNQDLPAIYQKISRTKNQVSLEYYSKCSLKNYTDDMLKQLEASTELDHLRGFTAVGPHRDDLLIRFDGHAAQDSASRGEVRTLLLALKIMELDYVEASFGARPILLLDDVFSELDGSRRKALTRFLKNYQTFITTTDADIVVKHFMDKCNIIPMN